MRCFLAKLASVVGREADVIPGLGHSLLEAVRTNALDAAILLGHVADRELSCLTLDRETVFVALPVRHPLASLSEVPVQALAGEPLVLFPRHVNPAVFDLYASIFSEAGVHPEIVEEPEPEGSRRAVAEGLGFTLVPSSVARGTSMVGVVHRPLADVATSIPVVLTWLAHSCIGLLTQVLANLRSGADGAAPL